jgi:tetrahydromethanopterin S-methyltransferase subunit G
VTSQTTHKLSSVLLDGKNYNILVKKVTFGIIDRDKVEFVNGEITIQVPTTVGEPIDDEKRAIRE